MKKIMILGAMQMHVPLICRAKELGYYTVTCDYTPDAPGHKIADEAYLDSTTDLQAVLALAQRLKIDAIMTYNSDPAAPTAAYVAEKMGLPGNPYQAVKIMSEKDLFRQFLKAHDLNHPRFISCTPDYFNADAIPEDYFPVIVKPVDSSGSKGCSVIYEGDDLINAVNNAAKKSRCKRVIIEEYIEPLGKQLHGDGFVRNGNVEFLYLGDHYFDADLNNLVPYSTAYPTEHPECNFILCKKEIQHFIKKVGFQNGGFNVELRISRKNGKAYIIDIGARNGGNFTPEVIEYAAGFNFLDAALAVASGNEINMTYKILQDRFFSHLILHSKKHGIFDTMTISEEITSRALKSYIYAKQGDEIEPFIGANTALGVLLMRYESREKMKYIIENFDALYSVKMK